MENTELFIPALERILFQIALLATFAVEGVGVIIIAFAVAMAVPKFVRSRGRLRRGRNLSTIRLDLGLSLSLALEFLLAADILGTAVSPSWDAIAKLAAIAGIRTFLNFFLHQEVKELEEETNHFIHNKERSDASTSKP
ncbi:MAG: DUF1622 domain-containing protein [Cyanobacteriota bacterium]|nr:DUF1622 domain-containing protein [Cyanobacteriota bacterium]